MTARDMNGKRCMALKAMEEQASAEKMCFGDNAGLWVDMTGDVFQTKELFSHDLLIFLL